MTNRTPAEQAAEALRKAKKHLDEWTPRHKFIDEALIEIDLALAALTAEAARVPHREPPSVPNYDPVDDSGNSGYRVQTGSHHDSR